MESRSIFVTGSTPTKPGWYIAMRPRSSSLTRRCPSSPICVLVVGDEGDLGVYEDLLIYGLDEYEWGQSIDDLQEIQAALVEVGIIGTAEGVHQLVEMRRQAEDEIEHLIDENEKLQGMVSAQVEKTL